jgi:hypothetical protein
MRKFAVVVVLTLLAFVVLALPASADLGVGTAGVSAAVSVGAEYDQWSARIAFIGSESGLILPANGVMTRTPGEDIVVQANFAGATGKWQYDLKWSNLPVTKNDQWRKAEFDPAFGWKFTIRPEDCGASMASSEGLMTPLQLRLVARGAKDSFLRVVIFKITYSETDVRTHDVLYIKTEEPACPQPTPPTPPAPSCEDVENALNDTRGAVNALGQQLADHTAEDAVAHEAMGAGIETANANAAEAAKAADEARQQAAEALAEARAATAWIKQATASGTPTSTSGVAVRVSMPPFRTTWVDQAGVMVLGPIMIRGIENGQVKVGRMPTATATWSSVADGTVFEFWWTRDGANWIRHQTTALRGREETIPATMAGR